MANKDSDKLSWTQVLILGLVPLGQLYARVKLFNGSVDKLWLMFPLLLIPPLSFIPLIMMKLGKVIIPIIAKLIIPFILPFVIDEDSNVLYSIVSFILQLITVMITNLIRRKNNCKEITTNSIGKATIDSTAAIVMGDLTLHFFEFIEYIPIIGILISILREIPFITNIVDTFAWSIGFVGTYIVINMFNQDPNVNKFCATPFTGNTKDKLLFFGSIVVAGGFKIAKIAEAYVKNNSPQLR